MNPLALQFNPLRHSGLAGIAKAATLEHRRRAQLAAAETLLNKLQARHDCQAGRLLTLNPSLLECGKVFTISQEVR